MTAHVTSTHFDNRITQLLGVELPIAFVRDASIADMLVDEGTPFVTTGH